MQIHSNGGAPVDSGLRKVARELESVFLAEMLRAAHLGEASESFGGGAGEEAFAGMLVTEQAKVLAEHGGIGLAENLYNALAAKENSI